MKILIAGGAGYIGSTIASACADAGIVPVIVDNLLTGRQEFVVGRHFYEGDVAEGVLIGEIFREHPDIYAVILTAALIDVTESVRDPISYYRNNVSKILRFIELMLGCGCNRLIFSSSASIYKSNEFGMVDENSSIEPQSPYARTKAINEWVFDDVAHSSSLRVLSFRYFNPIGADPKLRTGVQSLDPTHALGKMIAAMERGINFEIKGTDFATRDGTGIRDYVHVWDVARAHLLALEKFDELTSFDVPYEVVNLGSGKGTTVRELLNEFNKISPVCVTASEEARRAGDTAGAYASFEKAQRLLDWKPELTLADGIRDALEWAKKRNQILGDA